MIELRSHLHNKINGVPTKSETLKHLIGIKKMPIRPNVSIVTAVPHLSSKYVRHSVPGSGLVSSHTYRPIGL